MKVTPLPEAQPRFVAIIQAAIGLQTSEIAPVPARDRLKGAPQKSAAAWIGRQNENLASNGENGLSCA